LSLIYFAKNQDVEADRSIASLIYIKSQDFFITSLFLLLFAIFTIDFFKVPYIYLISGIFIFIIAIILQLIIFGSKSITNLINKIIIFIQQKIKMIRGNGDISSKSGSTINNTSSDNTESINNLSETHEKEGFLSKIIEKISLIQGNLGDLINLKIYSKYFVLTFIIKVIQLITTLIIFRGLNIQLPFFVILINDLFLAFVDFIPLSLIASLGFYEFTFASLIIVQELKLNSPYSVAFSWHIIGITFQTLIFLIGLGVNLINRPRSK
ncbi:MAG: lysylphosphatidylglycerol synthase domain-containing protein, partial [Promethearchaeota archaeon]